ncbi:Oxidoreductase molybdopterin binding domain protein [Sporotomaculum syntrophicum]|uniref:Oxidoreductase molybdopterin binding domain protein n=2 Tax=Sporotomaculum syntrophicum TaxID=182264 RepID=A0A9D3AV93_9FIRM|nr:Oxidoreductase molybdopterin binding domain protein [Sporotomaculum syntrophicum]
MRKMNNILLALIVLVLMIAMVVAGCTGQNNDQEPLIEADPVAEKNVLTIEGSGVAGTTQLTLQEIQGMQLDVIEDDYFALNNFGTKQYFSFKGVSLWQLLNKVGVKDTAQQVVITSEDGYSVIYTIDEVKREDYIDETNPEKKYKMIIAWEENGEVYDSTQYPFRLVMGQKEPGDINKQNWVAKVINIKVD